MLLSILCVRPISDMGLTYFGFWLCLLECLQSDSQACEGFRKQLNALAAQAEEAEEVLKQPDPDGSSELTLVQKRMEKLRVRELYPKAVLKSGLSVINLNLNV